VGATSVMPLSNLYSNLSLRVEGRVTTSIGDAPDGRVQYVTPGLAAALGLTLLSGRFFTDADGPASQPVVVVSESFAETFWPGQDPVGKTMKVFANTYPWMTVIGVVADLKHDRLDQPAAPMWYVPASQSATTAYGTPLQMFVVLKTAGSPAALVPAVRNAIARVDPTAPISRVELLEDVVTASVSGRKFTTRLLESFGALALLLACIGVYGVTALAVAERRGEIGLRKALGAGTGSIARLIARENMGVAATGTALGVGGGLVATRLMQSLLYGVGMVDPRTVIATLLVLTSTVAVAAALPAWRAMRTEALVTLREEV
jgi:predicted permease